MQNTDRVVFCLFFFSILNKSIFIKFRLVSTKLMLMFADDFYIFNSNRSSDNVSVASDLTRMYVSDEDEKHDLQLQQVEGQTERQSEREGERH